MLCVTDSETSEISFRWCISICLWAALVHNASYDKSLNIVVWFDLCFSSQSHASHASNSKGLDQFTEFILFRVPFNTCLAEGMLHLLPCLICILSLREEFL